MIMDRPTGVFINYLTVCCQSLSIKKMIELTQEELKQYFSEPIFGHIAETADALGLECYVVGGYVRDIFLQRPSKDIDGSPSWKTEHWRTIRTAVTLLLTRWLSA